MTSGKQYADINVACAAVVSDARQQRAAAQDSALRPGL